MRLESSLEIREKKLSKETNQLRNDETGRKAVPLSSLTSW
jgi:hypothetical protein